MNKQEIIQKLIFCIEDCFNVSSVSLSDRSTLSDFEPDELDEILFLAEIEIDFDADLDQVYGQKLLTTPLFEIAEYLEKHSNPNPNSNPN